MTNNQVFSIANNSDLKNFNYQELNPQMRHEVQELTLDIKNRLRRCAQDIYIIGDNLCKIKEQLQHGQFRTWLKAEFDWSVSAANKFMQVSQQFQLNDLETVEISPSALYILAAPSTPQEVRTQALDTAKQGQTITFSFAKQLLKQNKEKQSDPNINNQPRNNLITQEYQYDPKINNQLFPDQSNVLDLVNTKTSELNLSVQIYSSSEFNNYLEEAWQKMFGAEEYLSLLVCQINSEDSKQSETLMFQVFQQLSYGLAFSLKRAGDFVGQYDENQCIAVLSNTDPEGVQCVVDRFMKWFSAWQKTLYKSDRFKTLNIHIGTASMIPKQGFTPHSLIETALKNKELMK
ncbi:hypothetical protein cce_2679 [Crocosphaera subtropica ATCC 51142]|uniref:GGDEF domain-containing protein n=1 Tax=Crocosphaera subtropica (strain ATCC 51142 / BH68) TaxID=43989 RepID=B1WTA5_CROS5|nr:DUF3102 domain-containing protein [Crocosphaera subtropica]ACB52027.1 hypothetical protein cce_2679 [Crocosphaera subtropica ATCC 51142]